MNGVIIIESGRAERHYWLDLWRYRELFRVLAWRDLSVRYKQTVIGVLWALIRPFLTMLIFTIIFGRIAKLPTDGNAPYALLVFAGILPWTFSHRLKRSFQQPDQQHKPDQQSLFSTPDRTNRYHRCGFRRLPYQLLHLACADGLVSVFAGLAVSCFCRFSFCWPFLASVGPAIWISSLNVKFRDFRYVIPFIVQFGLYVSPVGFSSNVVPHQWRFLYSFNPMVGVIDGFRWCILRGQSELYPQGCWQVLP